MEDLFSHWQWVEEYFGDFKYILLFNSDSEIPPPDPMRKLHPIGFYGDRALRLYPFLAKRRNFRLPAVGFWSLAFPFFACAGSLPPAGTRAPILHDLCFLPRRLGYNTAVHI